MTVLSNDEVLRYSRHLLLPEVSLAGQHKLKAARVLCVGAGGLGSPLSLYLAAAGVGRLGLAEFDQVDLSNIQRQILYSTADVGRPKLDAACERLRQLNPAVEIVPHALRVSSANVMELIRDYDIVADGTDNFPTRYLLNDACVLSGKPNVYAGIFRFEGQLSVFDARRGPCYRCLFPEPPPPGLVPSCAEGGVLGVLPGILGTLQALEVLKLILGAGEPMIGRLLLFDALACETHTVKLKKDAACLVCGQAPSIHAPIDYEAFCGGATASVATPPAMLSVEEYAARRAAGNAPELIDVREPHEVDIVHIERARHIALGQIGQRLHELDPARPYVLSCHRGPRSMQAYRLLQAAGFEHLYVLAGGIDAWAARIDPSLPRY